MALKFLNDGYFAGKVGIGIVSPSATLHLSGISQTGTKTAFRIDNDSGNNKFFVNSVSGDYNLQFKNASNITRVLLNSNGDSYLTGGKVGIGTASPGGKLDIAYTGTGGTGTFGIGEGLNITSFSPNITFNDNSSGVDNYSIHLNQNVFTIGRYTSSTSQSPDLVLKSGNVGIGTTSPDSKLQVNVGTDQNVAINSTGGVSRISAYDDAVANSVPLIINGSDLRFHNNTAEAVRITGGNVGIGTDSPDV